MEAIVVQIATGMRVQLRQLGRHDAISFGLFLGNLSAETRSRFEPHELTVVEGQRIAADQPDITAIRAVALDLDGSQEILAYVLVELIIPDDEVNRYLRHGRPLGSRAVRIAPVVADSVQNHGLGRAIISHTIEYVAIRGFDEIVLFGGVQTSNTRAIHVYESLGFVAAGVHLNTLGIEEQDMLLALGQSRASRGKVT